MAAAAADRGPPLVGDETDLFRKHHRKLVAAVRGQVTAPPAVIEDACAFAWLELVRLQPHRDQIAAWLRKVAIREAIRQRNRQRTELAPNEAGQLDAPDRRADPELALEVTELLDWVASLPPAEQTALLMFAAGHSYQEIAIATGATERTVDRCLAEGRDALRGRDYRTENLTLWPTAR